MEKGRASHAKWREVLLISLGDDMSDITKGRLGSAVSIIFGALGLLLVDEIGPKHYGFIFIGLFGQTGALWAYRVICITLILIPLGVYWLHRRSERRVSAYFKRQSMLEPGSNGTTRRQQ